MRTMRDLDVVGKRVFLRTDFNVPLEDGRITDDSRIRASLPTIQWLLDQGASLVIASHLGRPKGKRVEALTMKPVAARLEQLLKRPVSLVDDVVGPAAELAAGDLEPGQILMLENLRFEPGEEVNDAEFAQRLAALADVYVDDAFGAAHRAHASTTGITAFLPSAAGKLMEREVQTLHDVMDHPKRPLAVLIGGAKISTKIDVLAHLLPIADEFFVGGGMANTMLAAENKPVGRSLVERNQIPAAREFLARAKHMHRPVNLPVDALVAENGSVAGPVSIGEIEADQAIMDIGPETARLYGDGLQRAETVVWNGPMGVFEKPAYAAGTRRLAHDLAEGPAFVVVGGGDSVAAIEQEGLVNDFGHISTGGGAALEFLEGRCLPGVAALEEKE
ncbi:MAG: phosphoglycerate kinase [Chloroflexota bacterium]